ncbi:MAG: signal peptidase I, partial [Firmicutes bacterium]|nr:signal peptidase I [Bacillota bacterium]
MNIPKKGSRGWVILRRVVLALCGVILGLNLYMINAHNLVGNQLPMPFGYGAAVVLSGSMEPTFSQGDLLVVKETDEFAEGDIVVYQDGIGLVVHRVVGFDNGAVITRGDANSVNDEPVALTAVKGKVLFWIGGAGHFVNFLKSPIGIILVLAAALLLIELPRRNEKRRDEEERERILEEIRRLKEE